MRKRSHFHFLLIFRLLPAHYFILGHFIRLPFIIVSHYFIQAHFHAMPARLLAASFLMPTYYFIFILLHILSTQEAIIAFSFPLLFSIIDLLPTPIHIMSSSRTVPRPPACRRRQVMRVPMPRVRA